MNGTGGHVEAIDMPPGTLAPSTRHRTRKRRPANLAGTLLKVVRFPGDGGTCPAKGLVYSTTSRSCFTCVISRVGSEASALRRAPPLEPSGRIAPRPFHRRLERVAAPLAPDLLSFRIEAAATRFFGPSKFLTAWLKLPPLVASSAAGALTCRGFSARHRNC
jgi:hypothetical protein